MKCDRYRGEAFGRSYQIQVFIPLIIGRVRRYENLCTAAKVVRGGAPYKIGDKREILPDFN
jgi:hypothetical protein